MSASQPDEWRPEHIRTLMKVLPVVLLIALGLFGGGVYFAAFQAELLLHGERAAGVVVELERGTSSTTRGGGAPGWFPIVTFETADGRTMRFRHRTGGNPPDYRKGDRVPVIYLPDAAGKRADRRTRTQLAPARDPARGGRRTDICRRPRFHPGAAAPRGAGRPLNGESGGRRGA
jgi:hypothetical protein